MGKVHHQIRLRILSCSRVSENHRGPEVPEDGVPVVECLDGLARITLEELAITHSVKDGILQNACSTKNKSGCRFGEKCSFAHRQVDAQPTKWSKSNNDKSAVALLKRVIGMNEDLLPTEITIDQGNLIRGVIKSWDKNLLNVNYLMHDNWVAYFRT